MAKSKKTTAATAKNAAKTKSAKDCKTPAETDAKNSEADPVAGLSKALETLPRNIETLQGQELKTYVDGLAHSFHQAEEGLVRMRSEVAKIPGGPTSAAAKKLTTKIGATERILQGLQTKATEIPFLVDTFGLDRAVPKADMPTIAKASSPTKLDYKAINVETPKQLSTRMTGIGPRQNVSYVDGELKAVPRVGKLRMKFSDGAGKPAGRAPYRLVARMGDSDKPVTLRSGRTDAVGFTSLNLSDVEAQNVHAMEVVMSRPGLAAGEFAYAIDLDTMMEAAADISFFEIPVPLDIIEMLEANMAGADDADGAGTIEDPDDQDVAASPDSFGLNEVHVDGNCCLRPRTEFPAKEYYFRQTVRLTDVQDVELVFNGSEPFERNDVTAPINYGDESPNTYAVLGGNVILGLSNLYKHAWYPVGRGLGQNLYSVSLLPCEEINLAFIDWTRQERDSRVESRAQSEAFEHDLQHNRVIDEVVDASISEHQSGSSVAGGGGASLDLGFFSIGGGGGGSSSSTSGRRNIHSSTTQSISDSVSQNASAMRHQRATVVTTSFQRESERIKTRTIHNHNMNHVMNVGYYQHVEHYSVKTELVEEKPVLLVPYAVDQAIFGQIPSFEKFKINPSLQITKFLDRHSRLLRRMVPWTYRKSFQSLSRLMHCADVYQIEQPFATFSTWDITLKSAWREGIELFVKTKSGQMVKLKPQGGGRNSPPRSFRSSPVRHDDIDSIVVNYDPSQALKGRSVKVFGQNFTSGPVFDQFMGGVLKHKFEDITVHATTDPSKYLATGQSFILDTSVGTAVTLSGDNPSTDVTVVSAPPVNFSSYRGREHEDYCKLKGLIAHIQRDPMRYMRAIWLTENPDRRAIRFDQFELSGTSLLDHIVNKPIGVMGNYVAFELIEGGRLVPLSSPDYVVSSRIVTVPTRGVFGEVYLSCCNATEKRDVERIIDQDNRCQTHAPDITGVTPGSRASRSDTTPSAFAAPIINMQAAPGVPDPSGMANAMGVLGTPDIFRDLSRGAELISFIDNATKEAFTSTRQHRAAMDAITGDVVRGLVSAYTGVPIKASDAPGASSSGTTGTQSSGSSGSGGKGAEVKLPTSAKVNDPALQSLNSELVRQSSPTQLSDHMQTIQRGVKSGMISPEQGQNIANRLMGGTDDQSLIIPASNIILGADTASIGTNSRLVDVKLRVFIPSPAAGLDAGFTLGVFGGDDRSFSYDQGTSRAEIHVKVDFGTGVAWPVLNTQNIGYDQTESWATSDTQTVTGKPGWWRSINSGATATGAATLARTTDNLDVNASYNYHTGLPAGVPSDVQLYLKVNGSNPLQSGAPAINADLVLKMKVYNGQLWFALSGSHDGFPAYELYLDECRVFDHDPETDIQSPWSLFPPSEYKPNMEWQAVDCGTTV